MKEKGKKEALLIVMVFAVLFIIFMMSRSLYTNGSCAVITVDGVLYGKYPLSKDTDIPIIKDNNEINHAVIENGTVYMKDAACKNHICISQGRKKASGESIVCLPNRVVIRIEGVGEGADYDVIAN